jgi:hypothetical protein
MKVKMPDGSVEEFSDDIPKSFIIEKATRMEAMLKDSLKVMMPDGVISNFPNTPEGRAQAKDIAQKMVQSEADLEEAPKTAMEILVPEKSGVMRAIEQGATLGLSDELAGAAGAVRGLYKQGVNVLAEKAGVEGDFLPLGPEDTYTGARDVARAKDLRAKEEGGALYTAAEMAAAVAGGGGLMKGAQSLKSAVTTGAGIGGAAGAGYSEADTVSDVAQDVVKGAAIGAALPAFTGSVGKGVKKVAEKAVSKAKLGTQLRELTPYLDKVQGRLKKSASKLEDWQSKLSDKEAYLGTLDKGSAAYKSTERQIQNLGRKVKEEDFISGRLKSELDLSDKMIQSLESQRGPLGKLLNKTGVDSKMLSAITAGSLLLDSAATGGIAGALVYKVIKGSKGVSQPLEKAITSAGRLRDSQVSKISKGVAGMLEKELKGSTWARVLLDAQRLSPSVLASAHYQLLTVDPEYRKEMKKLTEAENRTLMFNKKSRSNAKD